MPRQYNRLSTTKVGSLKEPGRYSDGAGLNLQITPAGVKSWIFRYERGGKERWHGLGPVRDVSLAEARDTAQECRRLLRQGIDPITHRQQTRVKGVTFEDCVEESLQTRGKAWRNDKHRAQWKSTLKTYAYPVMGSSPVKDIQGSHILQALKPIWQEKPETARRLRGRLESVLDYATAHGYRDGENPARWKGHLSHLLGKVGDRAVKHHAAMPFKDLPAYMDELKEREGAGARALELTILTAARTSEIIEAQWREFDLEEKVWTIPAGRMKAKREHRVPLSLAAVECLKALPIKGDYVFPGAKAGRPISNMTMAEMLKGMGYGHFTVHGFRSTFRDWAAEKTSYANHVVEMALAHVIGDKVEAAYRRGDLFEKRRQLMADWADFCDMSGREGEAVPIRTGRGEQAGMRRDES